MSIDRCSPLLFLSLFYFTAATLICIELIGLLKKVVMRHVLILGGNVFIEFYRKSTIS
jgi:hypothetical protein